MITRAVHIGTWTRTLVPSLFLACATSPAIESSDDAGISLEPPGSAGRDGSLVSTAGRPSNGSSGSSSGGRGGTEEPPVPEAGAGSPGDAGMDPPDPQGGGGSGGGEPPVPGALWVQYRVSQTAVATDYLGCQLQISNFGDDDIPLAELSLRYYLTSDIAGAAMVQLFWAQLNPGSRQVGGVSAEEVIMQNPVPTADTYVEFTFTGADVLPAREQLLMDWQIFSANPSSPDRTYDQSNDHSFNPDFTQLMDWDHVVLLQNGTVVWGIEPN